MDEKERFETFTEQARVVLSLALEEAHYFQHNYTGTEHLLLGLVRADGGVAANILKNFGVEMKKVRSVIEFILGRGDCLVPGEISLTPHAKNVVELAVDEARRLNHFIGTEYLLLGLMQASDGLAVGILKSLDVNLEKVRTQTMQMLNQSHASYERYTTYSTTPALDEVSIDLTAAAVSRTLDPVIGRHQEIERAIQILARRTKNNPVLIGEPGVGKTAIVEGLP